MTHSPHPKCLGVGRRLILNLYALLPKNLQYSEKCISLHVPTKQSYSGHCGLCVCLPLMRSAGDFLTIPIMRGFVDNSEHWHYHKPQARRPLFFTSSPKVVEMGGFSQFTPTLDSHSAPSSAVLRTDTAGFEDGSQRTDDGPGMGLQNKSGYL